MNNTRHKIDFRLKSYAVRILKNYNFMSIMQKILVVMMFYTICYLTKYEV